MEEVDDRRGLSKEKSEVLGLGHKGEETLTGTDWRKEVCLINYFK